MIIKSRRLLYVLMWITSLCLTTKFQEMEHIWFDCIWLHESWHVLRFDCLADLTKASIIDQITAYGKQVLSNSISSVIMQYYLLGSIRDDISEWQNTECLLEQNADQFIAIEKVKLSPILNKLISTQNKGKRKIREYIFKTCSLVMRLKVLKF